MPEGLSNLARALALEWDATMRAVSEQKAQGEPRKWSRIRDSLNDRARCTLTCFKLAFHQLCLSPLPTVKEPALALTTKDQSGGTPGWGWVCCTRTQKCHIHRHLPPCNEKITQGLLHITAQFHQKQVIVRFTINLSFHYSEETGFLFSNGFP